MRALPILASLLLVACGGDGGDDGDDQPAADAAPPGADAVPLAVSMVACAGGEPIVTTPGLNYDPMVTTIAVGERVRFMLGSTHNVLSTTTGQPFMLPLGADACLQFAAAGTFTFRCSPHGFTGSVVVQ